MTGEQMMEMLTSGQTEALEAAWMQAVDEKLPAAELAKVLEALVAGEQLDLAETLGWELLAERAEQLPPAEALEVARTVVSAVPISDELRSQTAQLYRKAFPQAQHFDAMVKASGLLSGQSPRRALRTLDVCLAIQPGSYLANRFDHTVIRLGQYNAAMDEFEAADGRGGPVRMEPKKLADEFEPVDPDDFRVLKQHRPEELAKLVEGDPAGLLKGICMSAGGQISATDLKEMMVPAFIAKEDWSGWWNRARTAAKRSEQLTLEGRSPIVVTYHPGGRTLEQEMAEAVAGATMPLQRLAVLQQYLREARGRKLEPQPSFTAPIMESLAEQARTFAAHRPGDALAATLAIEAAKELGLPAPTGAYNSPEEILARAARPAHAVAGLENESLWLRALDALSRRPDGPDQLATLLHKTPASLADEVTRRLHAVGRSEVVTAAVAEAVADPPHHIELAVWLWRGPATRPENAPGRVELLGRLLNALHDLDHDWEVDPSLVKRVRQRMRAAMSASDYAGFRQAVREMDEAVAGTIKTMIQRTDGLAEAVQDTMLNILRESFYTLFMKTKVEPWLDENAIWTTDAALRKREDELKYLVDVKMFENAKAIGAAAEHGDLSENSEWKFALEERDLLRARAAKMQEELAKARIIQPENVPVNYVGIGSKVRLTKLADGGAVAMSFLGPWDSDLDRQIYSYQTPLAQSLMGHSPGDVLTLKVGGEEGEYRIEEITSALAE